MALPYFFVTDISNDNLVLEEDTSKHMISVLRMQRNEQLLLTDGKGNKANAVITDDNRKKCAVQIVKRERQEAPIPKVAIGISLIKNASRFEWFLEKAAEIGVSEILPLICSRTEKEKFRHDRLQTILISALLQSQQCWLPVLHEPVPFEKALHYSSDKRFIAHCDEGNKQDLANQQWNSASSKIILIGPEGDFTPKEIEAAVNSGFEPVSLGNNRLRTETAGMVAAVLLCLKS